MNVVELVVRQNVSGWEWALRLCGDDVAISPRSYGSKGKARRAGERFLNVVRMRPGDVMDAGREVMERSDW